MAVIILMLASSVTFLADMIDTRYLLVELQGKGKKVARHFKKKKFRNKIKYDEVKRCTYYHNALFEQPMEWPVETVADH